MKSTPSRFTDWSWCLLALAWVVLLHGCGGAGGTSSGPNYVAVIDAGSSGTRITLFERSERGSEQRVSEVFSHTGGAALASFASSPGDAGPKAVEPLLMLLKSALSPLDLKPSDIRVHLMATAGMRLLEASNPQAAAAIYASARASLQVSGFGMGRVETISGQEEGLYTWVDVNQAAGRFQDPNLPTLGMVEVGGASTQVAFATDAADSRVVVAHINGLPYRVFSVSFLGLGQNEARQSMLLIDPKSRATGQPCYPNNSSAVGGLAGFDAGIGSIVVANGQFDFVVCSVLYGAVTQPFALGQLRQLSGFSQTSFIGVASLSFALSDWRALADTTLLARHLQAQCVGSDVYGSQVLPFLGRSPPGNTFTQNACANGTYMQALMFGPQGMGLSASQIRGEGALGQSHGWARGFAYFDGSI